VSFVGVYWNEEERLPALLELAGMWFRSAVIGIQHDKKSDFSLEIAEAWVAEEPEARQLIVDRVHGLAEPTLHEAVQKVRTIWSFVVSGDEWPEDRLLASFNDVIKIDADGFWVPFVSSIEGIVYESEQDQHLRLFQSRLGWPSTMHSRPPAANPHFLPREGGRMHHDRSLDEMVLDYLRYLEQSSSDADWRAHNRMMIHDACAATAQHKGWGFVSNFEWWPEAKTAAFGGCVERCTMGAGYDCHA
jgi:hypothetical protein